MEPLEWTVRTTAHRPSAPFVVAGLALVAGFLGLALTGSLWGGIIGVVVILLNGVEAFLPVQYKLDETGAHRTVGLSRTLIHWENVRRIEPENSFVRLLPHEKPSRFDAFRGVTLRFASNRDEVLAKIHGHLGDGNRTLERTTDTGGTGSVGE